MHAQPTPSPKIALAGMYRQVWAGDKQGQYARSLAEMEALAQEWGFELFAWPEPLTEWQDADRLRRALLAEQADLLLLQTSSFGSGDLLLPLLEARTRMGLWSVPEPGVEGRLPLNSLCGANHLVSTILRDPAAAAQGVKWFHGQAGDPLFRARFRVTVDALRGLARLRGARIGLIGGHATGFQNTHFDRRVIEARYGVRFFDHELAEIYSRMRRVSEQQAGQIAGEIEAGAAKVNVERGALKTIGSLEAAVRALAEEQQYDALAVRCWPEWQGEFGIAPCTTLGRLNELGIPTACEGDALGAVAMLLLNGIANAPVTLMDLIAFDESDETLLLWHCGPSPLSMADEAGVELVDQFNQGVPSSNNMVFRKDHGTVLQILGDGERLFLMDGRGLGRDKKSYNGSRGWFADLRLNGQPAPVMDVVNTLMSHGITHHYALALGDYSQAVLEAASWLGVEPLPPVRYSHRKPLRSELGGGDFARESIR